MLQPEKAFADTAFRPYIMIRKVATALSVLYEVKLMDSLSRDQHEQCYCNGDIMDSLDRTVDLLNSALNLSYTKYCSE
jgi:hypothetical protein